jgi:ABC-type enterobactin transport system permease subunit
MLAVLAPVMVCIALDELVPVARSFGEEHLSILGVVVGMAVMAARLWMLRYATLAQALTAGWTPANERRVRVSLSIAPSREPRLFPAPQ